MTVREEVYTLSLEAFLKNGLWALPMTVLPILVCTNALEDNCKRAGGFACCSLALGVQICQNVGLPCLSVQ